LDGSEIGLEGLLGSKPSGVFFPPLLSRKNTAPPATTTTTRTIAIVRQLRD
jgi:hypothetical protein